MEERKASRQGFKTRKIQEVGADIVKKGTHHETPFISNKELRVEGKKKSKEVEASIVCK